MRVFMCGLLITLAIPLAASADPSTSKGYTAKDQAQFAKLAAGNGTWTCIDTPPDKKPDIITGKQSGNWYVWSETGDEPSTTYVRWNHTMQMYTQTALDEGGSEFIATTKSLDPFNATWTVVFPTGAGLYPFKSSFSGGKLTWLGTYKDDKGKIVTYKSVCTKS